MKEMENEIEMIFLLNFIANDFQSSQFNRLCFEKLKNFSEVCYLPLRFSSSSKDAEIKSNLWDANKHPVEGAGESKHKAWRNVHLIR